MTPLRQQTHTHGTSAPTARTSHWPPNQQFLSSWDGAGGQGWGGRISEKVTLDEVTTPQRFLLAVKTPPHFGNLCSKVNQTAIFSSGTKINFSYVTSFLLGWENYGDPLDEKKFKLMKSPQATPRLQFLLFQGEREEGCYIWTQQ